MKKIKFKFVDFWPGYNPSDNYFINLLKKRFDIELSEDPDVILYFVFGRKHRKYQCFKIFWTGENIRPNFKQCDFAFTCDHIDLENHYRLPLYGTYLDSPDQLIKENIDFDRIKAEKTKFCNFVYSDSRCKKRIKFFEKLSQYKRVDSAGKVKNNMSALLPGGVGGVSEKIEFLNSYKFTIAFEVTENPGYTTEKMIHPMMVDSIPIYWGNPLVHLDFNPKSFVNYYDFANEDEVIERIIEIDNNDDLYREYLMQPYYHNNEVNSYINPDNILDQFQKIFERL